jgi:serine/threonine protein kinase
VKGLQVAHTATPNCYTHNDIRPSNILIFESEGELQPLILDWGHATPLSTKSPNHYGTLAYASNKFLSRNNATPSPSTDLESVVYLLLFMLIGHLPWHKAQAAQSVLTARKKISDAHVLGLLQIINEAAEVNVHNEMIKYLQSAAMKLCILNPSFLLFFISKLIFFFTNFLIYLIKCRKCTSKKYSPPSLFLPLSPLSWVVVITQECVNNKNSKWEGILFNS